MPVKRPRIDWETIDPILRSIYRQRTLGGIRKLAVQFKLNRATLSKRAIRLGLREKGENGFGYTNAESELMIKHYTKPLAEIQRLLVARGFPKRTKESLSDRYIVMRKQGWVPTLDEALMERNCYSIRQVGELLGVGETTVHRWMNNGLLRFKGQVPKGEQIMYIKPIRRNDLYEFMKKYPSHWDCHKCNHLWLVDILTSPDLESRMELNLQDYVGVDERKVMYRDC